MEFLALDSPPTESDSLYWADFVEFRAILHPDKCYSRGELASLLGRSKTLGPRESESGLKVSPEIEPQWQNIVGFCEVRIEEFGEAYPFKISDDRDTLELHYTPSSAKQAAYLQLLLASLMRHIPKQEREDVARFFEEVSLLVMSSLMPQGTEVHPSWASPKKAARYSGHLFDKMTQIASDIRCTANFKKEDFKSNNSGDGGIDIVSWHTMLDEREAIPIAFAQCSCSRKDWKFKLLEAHPAKHHRKLPAAHPWATYYFTPFDMRRPDGDWERKSETAEAIIVDRLRLLRLSEHYEVLPQWPTLSLLPCALESSQP